jgi:hypothetical protein
MPIRKSPSPRSTTLAGRTLRDRRASKTQKSLAGTVLALDPEKGQGKAKPKPKRRKAR